MKIGTQFAKGAGINPTFGWFSFFPNGASDPVLASCTGPLARFISSVTYQATGQYTIVFSADMPVPNMRFIANQNIASLAAGYTASVVSYTTATRTLVVQAHNGSTTGVAVAANSNAFITVEVFAEASEGA